MASSIAWKLWGGHNEGPTGLERFPSSGHFNSNGCVPGKEFSRMERDRDIDYAAVAVKKAIVEKFRDTELDDLQAMAGDMTVCLEHAGRKAEGARSDLLAAVREASSYLDFWQALESDTKNIRFEQIDP